jgi:hypothetical protein
MLVMKEPNYHENIISCLWGMVPRWNGSENKNVELEICVLQI